MKQPAFSPQNIPPLFSEQNVALFTRHKQESLSEGYEQWFLSLPDSVKVSKKIQPKDVAFLYRAVMNVSTEKREASFLVSQKDVPEYNKLYSPTHKEVENILAEKGFEVVASTPGRTSSWRPPTQVLRPGTVEPKPQSDNSKRKIIGGVNPPIHPPAKRGKMAAAGDNDE
jgi:hypothetical protein